MSSSSSSSSSFGSNANPLDPMSSGFVTMAAPQLNLQQQQQYLQFLQIQQQQQQHQQQQHQQLSNTLVPSHQLVHPLPPHPGLGQQTQHQAFPVTHSLPPKPQVSGVLDIMGVSSGGGGASADTGGGVPYPEGYVPPAPRDPKKKTAGGAKKGSSSLSTSALPFGSSSSASASTAAGMPKSYSGVKKPGTGAGGANDASGKKKKKMLRAAGGEVWEDPTLLEWDPNDFRLFCGDIGNEVTDDTLWRAFSKYPSLQKAHVARDKRTQKSKGYGFVSFKDADDFVKAMREMNGKYVGNRPIKLRKSTWDERNVDAKSLRKTLMGAVVKKT